MKHLTFVLTMSTNRLPVRRARHLFTTAATVLQSATSQHA